MIPAALHNKARPIPRFQMKGPCMLARSLASLSALVLSALLSACNATDSGEKDGGGSGSGLSMRYDGKTWPMAVGICPGTTDYVSTFTLTNGDDSRVLYVQSAASTGLSSGTFTVAGGADEADSLEAGTVGVSLYDLDFNFVAATGGSVTITFPTSSTARFEGTGVTFANGKTGSFTVVASNCRM